MLTSPNKQTGLTVKKSHCMRYYLVYISKKIDKKLEKFWVEGTKIIWFVSAKFLFIKIDIVCVFLTLNLVYWSWLPICDTYYGLIWLINFGKPNLFWIWSLEFFMWWGYAHRFGQWEWTKYTTSPIMYKDLAHQATKLIGVNELIY